MEKQLFVSAIPYRKRDFQVVMGGGRSHFLPAGEKDPETNEASEFQRIDGRNLIEVRSFCEYIAKFEWLRLVKKATMKLQPPYSAYSLTKGQNELLNECMHINDAILSLCGGAGLTVFITFVYNVQNARPIFLTLFSYLHLSHVFVIFLKHFKFNSNPNQISILKVSFNKCTATFNRYHWM